MEFFFHDAFNINELNIAYRICILKSYALNVSYIVIFELLILRHLIVHNCVSYFFNEKCINDDAERDATEKER